MSFTGALLFSVYGLLYSGRSIATCLRRFLHSWRMWGGIIFRNIGGSIIFTLGHIHLRRFIIPQIDMYFASFLFLSMCTLKGCVHPSYGETECKV
jgi:hypothetical protein